MSEIQTKLQANGYRYPATLLIKEKRVEVLFKYNVDLIKEIKTMKGAKYHGYDEHNPRKIWSVEHCARNWFQLQYLMGQNPYVLYDKELLPYINVNGRELYEHQKVMVRHGNTCHYVIWGAEVGTGKTLSAIEVMEQSELGNWWWIGPKSALHAVQLEFRKWQTKQQPRFMTYENLVKVVKEGEITPDAVVFDESSKLKNPTAQRTQAAQHLAESIRDEKSDAGYVIEMTGTPAPKSPLDWWSQAEIACPGYLKEGDIHKFKNRLGVVTQETSVAGGKFARIVTWKDDDKKCTVCGLIESDECHDKEKIVNQDGDLYHKFEKSENEVDKLYRRLKGLTQIIFKKDCLDLPKQVHQVIYCKPTKDILNAAKLIQLTAKSAIQTLTLMRELSDGFQYRIINTNEIECGCINNRESKELEGNNSPCPLCHGSGKLKQEERQIIEVPCPKDDALINLLDQHDDYGRLVVYAGFTASIDRVVNVCKKNGWQTIRVDCRGWHSDLKLSPTELIEYFQDYKGNDERTVFVGHPGSAGMGLTLTASPSIVYYSNDFNAESRIQSSGRIDRPGSRGNNIFDLVHLPTDQLILDNLQKKMELQAMSMGDIAYILNTTEASDRSV